MHRTASLPIHPRTGLRAVGVVNGRPVWPILGAAEDPSGAAPNPSGSDPPLADPAPAADPAPKDDPGKSAEPKGDGDKKYTQADIDKAVENRLAREKKKYADYDDVKQQVADAEKARQDQLDAIATALGIKAADQPQDPDALQRTVAERGNQISSLEQDNAALRTELDAWRAAVRNEANPLDLLDRRSFLDQLAELDRSKDGYSAELDKLVKKVLEDNPSLRANTAPRAPKPDPSQGSGRGPSNTDAARGVAEAKRRFGDRAVVSN